MLLRPALDRSPRLRLLVLCCLYFAQGVPWGFCAIALMAWLGEQGRSTSELGDMMALATLPWAFKWLLGPIVDGLPLPGGRRRPYIILGQGMMAVTLMAMALWPGIETRLDALAWLILLHNCFNALQDVAVDGLAVDLLRPIERGRANGLMFGSKYLGGALGGGAMASLLSLHGLQTALWVQAVLMAAILLLPLWLRERSGDVDEGDDAHPAPPAAPGATGAEVKAAEAGPSQAVGIRGAAVALAMAMRERPAASAAVLAVALQSGAGCLSTVSNVYFTKSLGWSAQELAELNGGPGLALGLLGSVVGGWLADLIGARRLLVIAAAALGGLWVAFALSEGLRVDKALVTGMILLESLAVALAAVSMFALAMSVSRPAVAATQFTAYMALLNLGTTLGHKLAAALDGVIEPPTYWLVGAGLQGVVCALAWVGAAGRGDKGGAAQAIQTGAVLAFVAPAGLSQRRAPRSAVLAAIAAAAMTALGCGSTTAPAAPDTAQGPPDVSADAEDASEARGGWTKLDAGPGDLGSDADDAALSAPLPVPELTLTAPPFVDVVAELGVGATETFAHCTLAADFDGDGEVDIGLLPLHFQFGTGWQASLRIYRMKAGKVAGVAETTIDTTLLVPNTGCALADPDDDGKPDVLVGGVGGLRWLRNIGSGNFVDHTEGLLPDIFDRDVWSIVGGDFDGDGRPDLALGNGLVYGACADVTCKVSAASDASGPAEFFCSHPPPPPAKSWSDLQVLRDTLLLGKPSGWVDASALMSALPDGELTEIQAVDLDADGLVDLLVGHDFGHHGLLRNTGKGGFALTHNGMYGSGHTMGWGIGDFDEDGVYDLLMSDLGPAPLYRQLPTGLPGGVTFVDVGPQLGVAAATADLSTWSPLVEDFDHDGHVDILLGTSAVAEPGALHTFASCTGAQKPAAQQYDLLLRNRIQSFQPIQVPAPMTKLGIERLAQTTLDFDGDGDLDVLQVRFDGLVRLLRNDLPKAGGAVFLDIRGPAGNRLATGVRVEAMVAGRPLRRQVLPSYGFGGGGRLRVHLPTPGGAALEQVRVIYPAPLHIARQLGRIDAGAGVLVVTPYGAGSGGE